MRVLHVINGDEYGGSERVVDLLAVTLPARGFEAAFVCVKPGDHARLLRERRWPAVEMPMRSRMDLRVVPGLVRVASRGGYAVLHSHTPRAAMVARMAAAAARLPLIHHVHGSSLAIGPSRLRNRVTSGVERLSLVGAAVVCAVSQPLAEEMRRLGVPARRIALVPNGVTGPAALPRRDAPSGPWLIGTAARLRPAKGIEVLLRAVAQVRGQGVPLRLRVLGAFEAAPYAERMRELTRRLGIVDGVEWAGFRADMPLELSRLDAFVLPSLTEGVPMAVLEAMAHGVPVVASRVGAIPEVLDHGACGVLVEPGDVDELAGALVRLIRGDPAWQRLRELAHRRQRLEYSADVMCARMAQVYRRALTGRGALPT